MTQQKERGAVRVVDTRGSSVDLSKYDERLDNFVPDSVQDMRGGNQKLKKGQAQNNKGGMNGKKGQAPKKNAAPIVKQQLHVTVPEEITVGELASRLKVTAGEVVKKLMLMGIMATVNQTVDYDTAFLIGDELGAIVERKSSLPSRRDSLTRPRTVMRTCPSAHPSFALWVTLTTVRPLCWTISVTLT